MQWQNYVATNGRAYRWTCLRAEPPTAEERAELRRHAQEIFRVAMERLG